MICKLCRNKLDPAHCESMYGLNPKTLKKAWFHIDCGVSFNSDPTSAKEFARQAGKIFMGEIGL